MEEGQDGFVDEEEDDDGVNNVDDVDEQVDVARVQLGDEVVGGGDPVNVPTAAAVTAAGPKLKQCHGVIRCTRNSCGIAWDGGVNSASNHLQLAMAGLDRNNIWRPPHLQRPVRSPRAANDAETAPTYTTTTVTVLLLLMMMTMALVMAVMRMAAASEVVSSSRLVGWSVIVEGSELGSL